MVSLHISYILVVAKLFVHAFILALLDFFLEGLLDNSHLVDFLDQLPDFNVLQLEVAFVLLLGVLQLLLKLLHLLLLALQGFAQVLKINTRLL